MGFSMDIHNFKTIQVYLHYMLCNYLKGDFCEAKFWQKSLREYNVKYPELFFNLDKFDIKRLKTISQALDNNQYTTWLNTSYDTDPISVKTNSEDIENEKDVVQMLLRNEQAVSKIIGYEIKYATVEQETQFGNIDIMAYSRLYAHPIEVKHNMATHAVVGQILKYMKHYLFRVNYGYFRDVVGVVIAKCYSETAYQELKKHNVIMLTYKTTKNNLELSKV